MAKVYVKQVAVTLPLAANIEEFWTAIANGTDSIRKRKLSEDTVLATSQFDDEYWSDFLFKYKGYSKFECLLIDVLHKINIHQLSQRNLIIYSTTKGNIGDLNNHYSSIYKSIENVNRYFNYTGKLHIISNACISGVLAINMAKRFIEVGMYDNVIVVGADVVSDFVLSGFHSFQAISKEKCRPFDIERDGINLGEGSAAIWLTNEYTDIEIAGTGATNDANHLSGPSKTGEELSAAINQCLLEANVNPNNIDIISAHGTATLYNDEMESKALHLSQVDHACLHSLKSYIGHTLGTAGVVETILLAESLKRQTLIPSLRYEHSGVPYHLNISTQMKMKSINYGLKTASGFGGCNAALILKYNA